MDFNQARFNMVEQQIRTWDVLDQTVLDTVMAIPRERFVPESYRLLAFSDIRIPLGNGRAMMTPKVEARLVQSLNLKPTDRVLEIGTGSGYVTALMAHLAQHVTTLEIDPGLSAAAAQKLRAAGLTNVEIVVADGLNGHAAGAPYDAIAVTGSVAARQPALEAQLAVGGRLFVVVGAAHPMEALLITRVSASDLAVESLFEIEVEPLVGAEPRPRFEF
jgi:protein-L-isoaspartate(D-aspartate) O-methyltransferase